MGNYMNFTVKAAAAGAISAAALALSAPAATAAIPGNPMSAPTCANQQVVFVPGGANTIPSAPSDVPHVRLPSFSGHPISADLVSVREDVHCESTTPEIHT